MRAMLRRLTGHPGGVEFCDACGTVCDHACRARARRDRDRDRALAALGSWR